MSERPENETPETPPASEQPTTPPKSERTLEEIAQDVERDIRRAVGNWVGAKPDDDWDTIGRLMEANFRGRVAEMVDAEPGEAQEEVTWDAIGQKIDRSLRKTIGGWAGAKPEDDWETVGEKMDEEIRTSVSEAAGEASRESDVASWEAIGSRVESNVRRGIGGWVHADPDADWDTIGNLFAERLRSIFNPPAKEDTPPAPSKKTHVPISGEDEENEPEA